MRNKIKLQNAVVIACAAGAAVGALYANTNLLIKSTHGTSIERERCYGISRVGQNDCATANHSCAAKAARDNDPHEWIMVPKGLCHKITGGVSD